MSDFKFTIEWDAERADRAIQEMLRRGQDLSPLMAEIAEDILLPGTQERFLLEVDPEGNAWPDLAPATWDAKRTNAILRERGYLYDSLRPEYGADFAQLGTDRPYGAIHQFGGTPDMAPGPADIPPRPFLGISEEDARLITEAAEAHVAAGAAG